MMSVSMYQVNCIKCGRSFEAYNYAMKYCGSCDSLIDAGVALEVLQNELDGVNSDLADVNDKLAKVKKVYLELRFSSILASEQRMSDEELDKYEGRLHKEIAELLDVTEKDIQQYVDEF